MANTNNHYFIAKDYLRAFDLKNLFHKYVVVYTQLNYTESCEPLSSKDRHELTLKLQETLNDISLHVLQMKEAKSGAEIPKHSSSSRSVRLNNINECRAAN